MTENSVKCREFKAKWTFYWTNEVLTRRRAQTLRSKMRAMTVQTRQSTVTTFCLVCWKTRESPPATTLTRSNSMTRFLLRRLLQLSSNRTLKKSVLFQSFTSSEPARRVKHRRVFPAYPTTAQRQSTFIITRRSQSFGAMWLSSSPWPFRRSRTDFNSPSAFFSSLRKYSSRTIN